MTSSKHLYEMKTSSQNLFSFECFWKTDSMHKIHCQINILFTSLSTVDLLWITWTWLTWILLNMHLPIVMDYHKQEISYFTHLFCEFWPFLLALFVTWKLSSLDLPNTVFRLLNFRFPWFIIFCTGFAWIFPWQN